VRHASPNGVGGGGVGRSQLVIFGVDYTCAIMNYAFKITLQVVLVLANCSVATGNDAGMHGIRRLFLV
jgi:hypothetical protein